MKTSWTRLSLVAVLSFVAGACLTAEIAKVRADSNRVFELRVYHTAPGKLGNLQTLFREHTLPMFKKHGLNSIGYWVPQDKPDSENIWIYILAHPSREEAKKNWAAFQADPEWQQAIKAAQADGKVVEKIDSTFMDPADISPLK
jgi:hypothetical protein